MLHESSLGQFDTEERATEAFEKELANAKKLGWGATNGADGKSCPGLLRKAYRDIHTVLLDAKEMDTGTSRLRTLIGNLHNRNRVLERQGDLSPAALRCLADRTPARLLAARTTAAADAERRARRRR